MEEILKQGLGSFDIGLLILRLDIGLFFLIKGLDSLVHRDDKGVWFRTWSPILSVLAGATLALGLFSSLSAVVLLVVATSICIRHRMLDNDGNFDEEEFQLCLLEGIYFPALLALAIMGGGGYALGRLL